MSRPLGEVGIWILISVISNFAALPAIMILMKQRKSFEVFVGCFTLLCSMMYHLCDSMELYGPIGIWLGEGSWHRFDNAVKNAVKTL